jgi:hypothetical protein
MGRMRARGWLLIVGAAVTTAMAPIPEVSANGSHSVRVTGEEPPTRFERFVLGGCVPCVTESHSVVRLSLGALKLPAFPRHAAGPMMRPGEIRLEALRAYELGRPSRQSLAVRMILSVAMGSGAETYRVGVGLLDEEEVPALAGAATEIARVAAAPPPATGAESVEISFQGGSLRVGLIRYGSEAVAYVQAGDLHTLALRPVWEVGSTMYLPPGSLAELAGAIGQVSAKIRQLRGP